MIQSPPRRVFRQTVNVRLAFGILFLLTAGIFIAVGLGSDPVEYTPVVIGALILAAYAALWVAIRKTTVTVFSEGVRRSSVLGTRELMWSDISEYRYQNTPIRYGGLVGGLIGAAVQVALEARQGKRAGLLRLTLVGTTRRDIRVTYNFKNAEQAIDMIVKEIHDRLRPELKRRLANGDQVVFGPLGLSVQGVSWKGKERIPMTEIGKAEISGRKLRVRRQGKMLDAIGVGTEKIPNVLLALELLQELRVNAGLSGVAGTFA
ncbi:MAG TPA: DUF6585 family protein [Thermoanaerobaculia bacterium]|jgi:hypothetical protein